MNIKLDLIITGCKHDETEEFSFLVNKEKNKVVDVNFDGLHSWKWSHLIRMMAAYAKRMNPEEAIRYLNAHMIDVWDKRDKPVIKKKDQRHEKKERRRNSGFTELFKEIR